MRLAAPTFLLLLATTASAAQFTGITAEQIASTFPYQLWSPVISVTAISGDGSTIGGTLTETGVIYDCARLDCGTSAFVWSHRSGVRRPLGVVELGPARVAAPVVVSELSSDGASALVTYEYGQYVSALHREDLVIPLQDPTSSAAWLLATDMTPDASVVVGSLNGTPFRWNDSNGFEELAGIAPGFKYSPSSISTDGTTVLLNDSILGPDPIAIGSLERNAVKWTIEGSTELPPLAGHAHSVAKAVSGDGSVVVGNSITPRSLETKSHATVWTGAEPSPLDPVFAVGASVALDVSEDGGSIVGWASAISRETDAYFIPDAILWRNGEAHKLEELLAVEYGLGGAIAGWSLTSATAISADGTVIAGQGTAPDGSSAAWVVVLTVPEPAGFVLSLLAATFVLGRSRR